MVRRFTRMTTDNNERKSFCALIRVQMVLAWLILYSRLLVTTEVIDGFTV